MRFAVVNEPLPSFFALRARLSFLRLAIAVASLLALSCVSARSAGPNPVYLTNFNAVELLPPSAFSGEIDEVQWVSGKYGDKDFSFNVYTKANSKGLCLELLSPMGTTVARLSYDGDVTVEAPLFTPRLKAEYIIMDFELCFCDIAELQKALSSLTIVSINGVRKVYDKKRCIIEIEYEGDKVMYRNYLRGYSYDVWREL